MGRKAGKKSEECGSWVGGWEEDEENEEGVGRGEVLQGLLKRWER